MVAFAGYSLPVQYSGLMAEHTAVRTACGLFDVSHMGEFEVSGAEAMAFLNGMTPNDVSSLEVGRAHYSALLDETGCFLDDLLVYRLGEELFWLVVNAATRQTDWDWLMQHSEHERGRGLLMVDRSDELALLALQGPKAAEVLAPHFSGDLLALRYYGFSEGAAFGRDALVSRTGYTGEDGFEIYLKNSDAVSVWQALTEIKGVTPAGLGARDTLRLEAGMMLSGQDIGPGTTPLEAGLQWMVKLDRGEFLGKDALIAQRDAGPAERVVGFEVVGKGIARTGYPVMVGERAVGAVTSGTFGPTLEKAVGIARLDASVAEPGTEIEIQVRKRRVAAQVVDLPFYKRPRKKKARKRGTKRS